MSSSLEKSSGADVHAQVERVDETTDPDPRNIPELKHETRVVSKKEALSAYMTIAAAAFGLISDGCKYLLHYHCLLRIHTPVYVDQNNLMTMTNVSNASFLACLVY